MIPILAAERWLGALSPGDLILLRRQITLVFFVGFQSFFRHNRFHPLFELFFGRAARDTGSNFSGSVHSLSQFICTMSSGSPIINFRFFSRLSLSSFVSGAVLETRSLLVFMPLLL